MLFARVVSKVIESCQEEVVKERERRGSHRGSATQNLEAARYSQRTPVQSNNYSYTSGQQMMTTADAQACMVLYILNVSKSSGESVNQCQTDVIGSMYKVDLTIHGVPTTTLIDSGSQVCLVRSSRSLL